MGMRVPASQAITEYLLTKWFPTPGRSVGDELPTIAELCGRFGVGGVQTVRDGVQPLKDAGDVETRYAPTRRWIVRKLPPAAQTPVPSALDQLQRELVVARDALNSAIAAIDQLRPAEQA